MRPIPGHNRTEKYNLIIIQRISLKGRNMEIKRSLQNEVIMPPRQAGGISHKITYVAHQPPSRCLIHDNVVIRTESRLCLELNSRKSLSTLGQLHCKGIPRPGASQPLTSYQFEFTDIERKQLEMFTSSWHWCNNFYYISQKDY